MIPHTEAVVRRTAQARIPTAWGEFTAYSYENVLDGDEHLAFVMGTVSGEANVLVRVHSECLTGDVFGSLKCDCGSQLAAAMERIAAEGRGVLVYLRGHEGRGIGIAHKLQAYALQDQGFDTVDANLELGLPVDSREYGAANVLVRVHSECLTGDVFGSLKCDCGSQLAAAMERIAAEGRGVLVYLRGHEGRGIGIAHKLQAYALQDQGFDTVDANLELGLPVDSREYGVGAQILVDLGVTTMRYMTNNPAKYGGIESFGLEMAERVAIETEPTAENIAYLRAKKERMGHLIELDELPEALT